MLRDPRVCWPVECAHRYRRPILKYRIPEQGRPAGLAKPPPHFFGRLIPSDLFVARDRQCGARHINRRLKMARGFATGRAMAGAQCWQRSFDSEPNRAAQAAAVMCDVVVHAIILRFIGTLSSDRMILGVARSQVLH